MLAAAPARKGAVEVELVSEAASIAPGQPFTVALRMQHEPHWHSYWLAAGTGYATSLAWTLPEGFKAGNIQWPTPHVVQDASGKIVGNGYVDENYLLVELTPPATLTPGSEVKLQAVAEWLMCKDVCMPGDARLELTLPVAATAKADAHWAPIFAAARAQLPKADAGWNVSASHTATTATLRLTPKAGVTHQPTELHFFAADGFTDYAQNATVHQENGTWVVELPLDSAADQSTARLSGVLVSGNGWDNASGYAGLTVDLPFLPGFRASENPGQTPGGQQAATGSATAVAAHRDAGAEPLRRFRPYRPRLSV